MSKTSADLCARVLDDHSPRTRLLSKIIRQSWFRPIVKAIERITIPGISLHYAFRKKCIQELARSAIGNGTTQVVVLGAGFDPLSSELLRGYSTVEFWEIDHPATQRLKARVCSDVGIGRLHFIAVDLSISTVDGKALINTGFEPGKRTFWIAEGLLMYFPADTVSSLMKNVSALSAEGSQFVFTFMEKRQDGHIEFTFQTKFVDWWLRSRGEPFLWGSTRCNLAETIRPWRVVQFFDHNNARNMQSDLAGQRITKGEVICLAAI